MTGCRPIEYNLLNVLKKCDYGENIEGSTSWARVTPYSCKILKSLCGNGIKEQ